MRAILAAMLIATFACTTGPAHRPPNTARAQTFLSAPQAVDPSFAVSSQVGQANFSTCQSYALAIALAFKRDAGFPITTWTELRDAELAIRRRIEAARDARGATEVSHADIKTGFEAYTGGRYRLTQRSVGLTELGTLIGSRTGVTTSSATPPNFLLGAVVNDVILSSATSIAGYPYANGHIFTILGVDGPPNSNRRYLILNSAARRGGQDRVACQQGFPDDSGPYEASLSWVPSNQVAFKSFGERYVAWVLD